MKDSLALERGNQNLDRVKVITMHTRRRASDEGVQEAATQMYMS